MTIPKACQERFNTLNAQQKKALYASPNSVLQVIAGPGTGKTHLITCRVAYLLTYYHVDPRGLIVTTFTKKASLEMKERLSELLKGEKEINLGGLFIGTFHSICLKFLRIHGSKIGFKEFSIADEADQNELLKKSMNDAGIEPKLQKEFKKGYISYISKKKALGLLPEECRPIGNKSPFDTSANKIYELYQNYLKINNKLDFDDILLYTHKLFEKHPECTSFVQHVLIDEFQDTNTIQLKLLYQMVKHCNDNVTVVGDADQSIYAFRNAEYSNFECMKQEFTKRNRQLIDIVLDQNYRSTQRILIAAEKLMRNQNEKREPKELKSQSDLKTPIILTKFEQELHETDNIAALIQKYTTEGIEGKIYNYNDFAVICRMRKTFRMMEMGLLHANIPYVIIKGTSFWEMKEIKMATDVLRCLVSNYDWLSFKRILTWYVENLGPTSIAKIEDIVFEKLQAGQDYVDILQILKNVVSTENVRATAKAKANLESFIKRLESFRELSNLDTEHDTIEPNIRQKLFNNVIVGFSVIQIAAKLKATKTKEPEDVIADIEQNVQEFRNHFSQFNPKEDEILVQTQAEMFDNTQELLKCNTLGSFLSVFLDEIYVYSTLQVEDEDAEQNTKPRVTICTIHASKGLEWPVVFIPSLIEGVFPMRLRGADITPDMEKVQDDEERRCFYVGITRAKHVVHLSTRESDAGFLPEEPSKFIQEIGKAIITETEPIAKSRSVDDESTDSFSHAVGFTSALDQFKKEKAKVGNEKASNQNDFYARRVNIETLFKDEIEMRLKQKQVLDDSFSDDDLPLSKTDDVFSDDSDDHLFIKELDQINLSKKKAAIEESTSSYSVETEEKRTAKGRKRKASSKVVSSEAKTVKKKAMHKRVQNPKSVRPMYPSIDQFFNSKRQFMEKNKILQSEIKNSAMEDNLNDTFSDDDDLDVFD